MVRPPTPATPGKLISFGPCSQAVLLMLSAGPHPSLLKQQPGREELANSSVVQASDLHVTLELKILSSKASEFLSKL